MARKNKKAGAAPLTSPQTREEIYLANIAGLADTKPAYPFTRTERYLDAICSRIDNEGLTEQYTIQPGYIAQGYVFEFSGVNVPFLVFYIQYTVKSDLTHGVFLKDDLVAGYIYNGYVGSITAAKDSQVYVHGNCIVVQASVDPSDVNKPGLYQTFAAQVQSSVTFETREVNRNNREMIKLSLD